MIIKSLGNIRFPPDLPFPDLLSCRDETNKRRLLSQSRREYYAVRWNLRSQILVPV